MVAGYHSVVIPYDARRDVVWRAICDRLKAHLGPAQSVLELGAGYGHFINNVHCPRRVAIDLSPEMAKYAGAGVDFIVGDCLKLDALGDEHFDVVFASNLLEHLTRDEISTLLNSARKRLNPGGKLMLLQPNYRYAYREYFDDYTHVTPLDHTSLAQMLTVNGFNVLEMHPRFMPYSMRSGFPIAGFLVRLYLRSPIKPLGKQMLCIAQPS